VGSTLARATSASDSGVAPYRELRERDLALRDRLFVAEGEVGLRVLATRGRFAVRSLLLEERRVDAVRDVLEKLPASVTAYVVPQAVMDEITGFHIHRGVLAIGERGLDLDPRAVLTDAIEGARPSLPMHPQVVVALVGLTNHDNVGGIFRNAAAFGARAVLLDAATCDPLYRKAIRVSAGAAFVVPFARCASDAAMLAVLAETGFEPVALTPRGEEAIDVIEPAPKRALLFGTEGDGLPESVLAKTRRVRIAMDGVLDSLNVAVASGIALHEELRRRRV